ncbi:MAG: HlyD family efflux transporter periplasmic adaptor subunit [Hyphomicrobiales bacterium]|nr:HlyD family efflux transporter periplasmic adaptor subunit [Hyphomicrobiales bacterium]
MAHQNVVSNTGIPVSAERLSLAGLQSKSPQLSTVSGNNADTHKLTLLLEIEAEIRKAETVSEWKFVVANETLKITNAIQIFVFNKSKDLQLIAISGLTGFERATPLVKDIEHLLCNELDNRRHNGLSAVREISFSPEEAKYLASYPFSRLLWVPFLSRDGKLLGGKLLAKADIWDDHEQIILKRLADTYAHALSALRLHTGVTQSLTRKIIPRGKKVIFGLVALVSILFIPVSMTVLAPFEVAPTDPVIVASPIDGIIDQVLVKPNERVVKGQKLVLFNNTVFKNSLALANEEINVAEAKLKKSGLMAFDQQEGRENIGISMANHSLKVTEQKYAFDMLARSVITANRDGVVLYSDRQSLLGVPVKPGERIMQIANPDQIELLIDVPTKDAIILGQKAPVKIYLDSDPLNAREANVEYINYQARERAGAGLSFRVVARLSDSVLQIPRMGVRGTAKIYGKKVPLVFYLFRRPISTFRQWVGL